MGSNAMKTYKSLGCYLTCTVFVNNIPHTLRQSNIYIALFFPICMSKYPYRQDTES